LKFSEEVVDVLYKELIKNKKDNLNIEEKKFLIDNFNNKIEFNNVDFVYHNSDKIIFEDLNIKILKGEKIGIIGSSGIGKSTFLDLLLGVIKPQKGEILYDGKNIKNINLNYKKILGYVPQSIFLIDGSIKENIAFGIQNNEINSKNLEQSVKRSAIENYVKSLPQWTRY
jgi:ABC-type bacteriocin/lantibiotic exporters, contain an N-terminal double-glycine peptidase domain